MAHAGYHVLAFLAYWFGAARFDKSEDGEFDPTDVQRMINNLSRHMRFSFSRPRPRGRRLRERLRERRRKQQQDASDARKRELAHEENLQKIHDAVEQEQGDAPARRPSVASNLSAHAERAIYGMERAGDAIQAAIQAPVVSPECVEETVRDNLSQFWPWFSVSQILVCFGLWLGYALQMHVYTVRASHALFDEGAVMETFTDDVGSYYACQVKCSTRGDACAGMAYKEGPKPECRLLSELHQDLQSIQQCSEQRSWNWIVYEKRPRTIGTLLATMGGLETAFPGSTSLQSVRYCEEGFRAGIFWRLLEYQFTHGGLAHVLGNCLVIFFVGVPLEGFHGTGLTALMYIVGVVGGGMAWMLLNPHRKVFGASGGAYALLGMQLADLVLNWRQKKFRFPIFVTLMVLVAIETAGYASAIQGTMTTSAHSVHLGGLASGFIIGMLLTYNIEKTRSEMFLQVAAMVAGLGLVCFAMAYWFDNPFPAIRSLLDAEDPFCWIGQVCMNEDGTDCDYSRGWQCVTCDTRECVENWYKDEYVFCVTFGNKEDCGDRLEGVDHKCVNC